MSVWLPLTDVKEDSPFRIKSEGLRPPLDVGESMRTDPDNQSGTQMPLPPTVDASPLALTSGGQSGNAAHRAKQRSIPGGSQSSAGTSVASRHTAKAVTFCDPPDEAVVEVPPDDGLSLRQHELEEQQKKLRSSAEQDRLKLAEALLRIEKLEILVAQFTATDRDEASSVECDVVTAEVDGPSDASLALDIMAKDFVPFVHFARGRNLDESVWEASLLVFLSDSGLMNSVCTVAALLLSAVTQFTFCAVSFVGFTNGRFPSVDEAKLWRYGSAHDAIWTTVVTDASLASRVCAKDSSLTVSTGQASLVDDIELYLSSLLSIPQGGLLCVVACLMWFHLVLAELLKSGNFWLGTCGLVDEQLAKRSLETHVCLCWSECAFVTFCVARCNVSVGQLDVQVCGCQGRAMLIGVETQQTRGVRKTGLHCKGDNLTFVGFGTRRFMFICVIVVVMVVIAFLLLYTGILWLLNTTSIEDIVLNAAALGFVMDLDEVLFVTLVAEPAKAILRKMEPLYRLVTPPLRLWGREAETDFIFPCFAWIGFAVLMGLVMPVITENVETMRDLQHQLCGGNLNFVVEVMPSTDVVLVKDSTPFVSSLPDSFEFDALEELVWSPNVGAVLLSLFTDTDFRCTSTKLHCES